MAGTFIPIIALLLFLVCSLAYWIHKQEKRIEKLTDNVQKAQVRNLNLAAALKKAKLSEKDYHAKIDVLKNKLEDQLKEFQRSGNNLRNDFVEIAKGNSNFNDNLEDANYLDRELNALIQRIDTIYEMPNEYLENTLKRYRKELDELNDEIINKKELLRIIYNIEPKLRGKNEY